MRRPSRWRSSFRRSRLSAEPQDQSHFRGQCRDCRRARVRTRSVYRINASHTIIRRRCGIGWRCEIRQPQKDLGGGAAWVGKPGALLLISLSIQNHAEGHLPDLRGQPHAGLHSHAALDAVRRGATRFVVADHDDGECWVRADSAVHPRLLFCARSLVTTCRNRSRSPPAFLPART